MLGMAIVGAATFTLAAKKAGVSTVQELVSAAGSGVRWLVSGGGGGGGGGGGDGGGGGGGGGGGDGASGSRRGLAPGAAGQCDDADEELIEMAGV
jgi:hypothetical protein